MIVNKEKVGKKTEPVAKIMTPEERKRLLIEGIKKTIVPSFIGAAFALLFVITAEKIAGKPWYLVLLLVVFVSYYPQKLLYPLLGVRIKEFEMKDWLYVEFMTIIFL